VVELEGMGKKVSAFCIIAMPIGKSMIGLLVKVMAIGN
jgi:hypothetical protein